MISVLENAPSGWMKVKFEDIAENVTDRIGVPSESGLEYYIGLEHLDTDHIRIKRFGSTGEVKATKYICRKGDIIFGKRRAYLRKLAVTDRDAVASAHSMVLRSKGNLICPDFLPCFMQSSVFWRTAHAISEGSMSPTIKWRTLAKQEFWIPSLPEQKKISEVLWGIEDSVKKNENLLSKTEEIKRGLLNKLLIKGIGHKTFEKAELGEIPTDWKLVKLGNECKSIQYGYTESASSEPVGPKFLRITDITNGSIDWNSVPYCVCSDGEYQRNKLQKGDIVFARTGASTGTTALIRQNIDAVFASYLIRLRLTESFLSEYVFYFCQSDLYWNQIRTAISGSAQGGVNASLLAKTYITLPPKKEQGHIVTTLDGITNQLDYYKINLANTYYLKKKLTNEFMSGKLRIPPEVLRNVQ